MPSDRKAQREPRANPTATSAKQTTKGGKPQQAPTRHRGHGPLGLDSEQSARLLLFGVTAAVLIAAAAFLVIGYYVTVIQPRGRTVLQVDETKVSYSAMKRRVAHEYYDNPSYQNPQSVYVVPSVAYTNLVDELVLVNRAEAELGLVIDQAALDQAERIEIGVGPEADEATYSERYRAALAASRLNDEEFARKIRASVIEDKANEKLKADTPASVPQAQVQVIVVDDLETAQQAIDRVRAGEDWTVVATALSTEADAATTGGLKDYNFESALPTAYATFAFSAPNGDISEPLQDPSGSGPYYVVRLVDRSDQPLTEEQKPNYEARAYSRWLDEVRAKAAIVDKWTTDDEAQASAAAPIIEAATEKFVREQQLALTPQPTFIAPTVDPNAIATAGAEITSTAQAQPAGSGSPVPTSSSGGATPEPPGSSNGQ